MTFRIAVLPLLFAVGLVLVLPAPVALAEAAADPVPLDVAEGALARLQKSLKSKRSVNEQLNADMDEVLEAYLNLAVPAEPEFQQVPEGASDDDRKAIEAANKKLKRDYEAEVKSFEGKAEKFRKSAEKEFIRALKLQKIHKPTQSNQRDPVNVRAAEILAQCDPRVSDAIIKAFDTSLAKPKDFDVSQLLLDKTFATLALLNEMDSLEWMLKEFTHTKNSPRRVVDQLQAAHKAMILFKNVPGALRYEIVDKMITQYSGVESQAEQSSSDPAIQAKKRFWDRIKNDAIKVVQFYAGEPTDSEGQVLARMDDFQNWFRKNDNKRRPPWVDEKKEEK